MQNKDQMYYKKKMNTYKFEIIIRGFNEGEVKELEKKIKKNLEKVRYFKYHPKFIFKACNP